jgi:glutathione S-transferase
VPAAAAENRLITIPISHFCEKARWALERAGVAYVEEPHLQGVHVAHALRRGHSRTVPVLLTADGDVVPESSAIMRWADAHIADPGRRLYPVGVDGAEAARLEAWLDGDFGADGRLWMYHVTLPAVQTLEASVVHGIPAWEKHLFRRGRAPLNAFLCRYLGVNAETATAALARIDDVFATIGARLQDGRPYLCGDRLTAADLTFAALSAPVICPAQYGSPLPPLDAMPPAYTREARRLRDTPAGRFALGLFARERHLVVG